MAKHPGGRPRGKAPDAWVKKTIRFAPAELVALLGVAARLGVTFSALVRKRALQKPDFDDPRVRTKPPRRSNP